MEPIVTSPQKDIPKMRLYPTELKVVKSVEHLAVDVESVKGYYDAKTSNTLQIGVRGSSRIYLNSPGNWYRAYTFKITGLPKNSSSNNSSSGPSSPKNVDNNMEQLIKLKLSDEPDELWKLVAEVIEGRLGRTVLHNDNDTFITLTNINSSMAKDVYYLFKNALKTKGYEFSVTYHLLSNPMSKGNVPDVRAKQKKRRPQKKNSPKKKDMDTKLGQNPFTLLKTNVYC